MHRSNRSRMYSSQSLYSQYAIDTLSNAVRTAARASRTLPQASAAIPCGACPHYLENVRIFEAATIGCTRPEAFEDFRAGDAIWFDGGKIGGLIERVEPPALLVKVIRACERGERCSATGESSCQTAPCAYRS